MPEKFTLFNQSNFPTFSSAVTYRMFLYVAVNLGNDGTVTIDQSRVAKKLGCSRGSILRAVNELVDADVIARIETPEGKQNSAARYRVNDQMLRPGES